MKINGVKHWETLFLRFAADQRNINQRQFKLIYTVVQLNSAIWTPKGIWTQLSTIQSCPAHIQLDNVYVWLLWHPENCSFLERNWHLRHFTLTRLQSFRESGKKATDAAHVHGSISAATPTIS